MAGEDPLARLLIDEREMARTELADVLAPYVRLGTGGDAIWERAFDALSASRRVVCSLLAVRAAYLLNLRESPGSTPGDLVQMTGMAAGTVRPSLSALAKQRLVVKENGLYSVPPQAFRRAADFLAAQS